MEGPEESSSIEDEGGDTTAAAEQDANKTILISTEQTEWLQYVVEDPNHDNVGVFVWPAEVDHSDFPFLHNTENLDIFAYEMPQDVPVLGMQFAAAAPSPTVLTNFADDGWKPSTKFAYLITALAHIKADEKSVVFFRYAGNTYSLSTDITSGLSEP